MNLDAIESGKSASQIRGEMLTQMVSSSSREIELCVSFCWKRSNTFIWWMYRSRKKLSLLMWRNKDGAKGFYLEKRVWAGSYWQLSGQWNRAYFRFRTRHRFCLPLHSTQPHQPCANNKTCTMLKSLVETWEVNNVVPALFSPVGYLGEHVAFF